MTLFSDPEVVTQICERYPELSDCPLHFSSNPYNSMTPIGTLSHDKFIGFVVSHSSDSSPFPSLISPMVPNEPTALIHHRSVLPVEAVPRPKLPSPSRSPSRFRLRRAAKQQKRPHYVEIHLRPVGDGHLWWANGVGLLWQISFHPEITREFQIRPLLNQYWHACEQFLQRQGVSRIYTAAQLSGVHDDTLHALLRQRAYRAEGAYFRKRLTP